MDSHAQLEIQIVATKCYEILKERFPISCQAWEDYVRDAKIFSKQEQQCSYVQLVIDPERVQISNREQRELKSKWDDWIDAVYDQIH